MWIAAAATWGRGRGSSREHLHRLAPLALGAVPSLVTLLATNKKLVVPVPTVQLCVPPSVLGPLACVVVDSSIALELSRHNGHQSSVTRAVSLASITAWFRRCWSTMLNSASRSCTTRLSLVSLSTSRQNSSGSILAAIASTSTWPCVNVYCRPPGFTSVSPLSPRYFRTARFCKNTLLSTGALASIFSTRKIWRQNPHHSSTADQRQQTLDPFH